MWRMEIGDSEMFSCRGAESHGVGGVAGASDNFLWRTDVVDKKRQTKKFGDNRRRV